MNGPSPTGSIVIDAVFFQWNVTGIARVWTALFKQWSENGFGSHVVVLDRGRTAPRFPGLAYLDVAPYPAGDDPESDRDMLEAACREVAACGFASTYYTFPRRTPSLFVAYDMIPEVMGMNMQEPDWARKRRAIADAARWIAISESTADDLSRIYPDVPRDQIAVAHCAAEDAFFAASAAEVDAFRAATGAPETYYVCVGARGDYKNGRLLAEAFSLLPPGDAGLLLVGGAPYLEPDLAGPLTGRNVLMGRLDDEQLRMAYAAAAALVFPSRYEGFGLPVLEAMACGCPVIACENSSIPEVAGDAAAYVADSDPAQLARVMTDVVRPEVRERMVAGGLKRAAMFSWARMADQVAAELIALCEEPLG